MNNRYNNVSILLGEMAVFLEDWYLGKGDVTKVKIKTLPNGCVDIDWLMSYVLHPDGVEPYDYITEDADNYLFEIINMYFRDFASESNAQELELRQEYIRNFNHHIDLVTWDIIRLLGLACYKAAIDQITRRAIP